MKEIIKETQPVFYRIIEKSFTNHTHSHAYLLVGEPSEDLIIYFAQCFLCQEDVLACEECEDCRRIKEGLFPDIIRYDGLKKSIKKDDISYIQKEFSKSSVENKGKLYILEHVENATTSAMNSLLKFLEEPEESVYAILTTNNINKVLPTIQSRCQVIQLQALSAESIQKILLEKKVEKEDALILSQLYSDVSMCLEVSQSEDYMKMKDEVLHFIEDLYFKPENLFINEDIHLIKPYSKQKDVIGLFLNLLVLAFKDVFHVKHSINYSFINHQSLLERIPEDDKIIQKIEIVLDTLGYLNTNANVSLLLEGMIIKILKENK